MNDLGRALAEEGMPEALWAGPRKVKTPAEITLAVGLIAPEQDQFRYEYEVVVGLPPPPPWNTTASFDMEPQIKAESLVLVTRGRRTRLLERKGRSVMARTDDKGWDKVDIDLLESETVLGRLEDSERFSELDLVRRTLLAWRFYHQVRTDAGSPLRRPCVAVASPSLASDGANLAAVFATLAHVRQETSELDRAIEAAFPGARLITPKPGRDASFAMMFPEFPQRQFAAAELSDGTLRFLALAGALLAYRLPPFIALNEPEASLHPDLMEPLAGMVVNAAKRSQVWLVTHSERLAQAVTAAGGAKVRTVVKTDGATMIEGLKAWGEFADEEDEGE
ncbi:MAG TPA: AAA family ATPase [Caulobacteraceae bacterium]|nr:AAA family ATPase [Caulobacteraceae bacterium]